MGFHGLSFKRKYNIEIEKQWRHEFLDDPDFPKCSHHLQIVNLSGTVLLD
jgi:hypothetical protein